MFDRQTTELLFPKVLWNRPISRATAGRLLLVGGHKGGVATLQGTHQVAGATGIGALTLLVPDVLRPLLGTLPEIDFGATTLSGSLGNGSLATMQELADHADAVVLGADASNNSETTILTEKFVTSYNRSLVLVDDAFNMIVQTPDLIRDRQNTLIVLSMQQLFKLAGQLNLPIHIRPDAGVSGKVEILESFWNVLKVDLALVGPEIIIKVGDKVSVTALRSQPAGLLPAAYGVLSVFYTQNQKAPYEGLTTGAYLLKMGVPEEASASLGDICTGLIEVLKAHE